MPDEENDDIVFRYAATLDEHGVIDGRELAAQLIEDAFSLLAPYAKGCRECTVSLFTGVGNRVIYRLVNDTVLQGRVCSYMGDTEEQRKQFFEAHLRASQAATDELLEVGAAAREAGARHKH